MKTKPSARTVGIGLGDRKHAFCVLDAEGGIITEQSITNTRGSLARLSVNIPMRWS